MIPIYRQKLGRPLPEMIRLRSLLFVPGNRFNMLEKATGFAPDAYIPDMEDSVPWEEKANARNVVASFLPRLAENGRPIIPRVNSLDTGLMEDDLEAVVGPSVYGVSVGKVDSAEDVERISKVVERLEAKAGLEGGHVKLVAWIETAVAIVNAYEICAASPRVVGVAFGAEDFTNDMGIERTDGGAEVAYPRSVICVAARAAGVLALDTPYFAFRDAAGLLQNARVARGQGSAANSRSTRRRSRSLTRPSRPPRRRSRKPGAWSPRSRRPGAREKARRPLTARS